MEPVPPVVPPFRFGAVEEHLYRSAHPTAVNLPFLKTLNLKSILCLTKKVEAGVEGFASSNRISIIHISVEQAFDNITLTHEHVAKFLDAVINPDNLPCIVHCYDGAGTTGLAIMCLRKLQALSVPYSTTEYERYKRAGAEAIAKEERWLVDSFKHEVRIPARVPRWLWGGNASFNHPSIALSHAASSTKATEGKAGQAITDDAPTQADGYSEIIKGSLESIINQSPELKALGLAGTF